jgi:hypothetical protein
MKPSEDISLSLASSLGKRDEAPNVLLASRIAKEGDKRAIEELMDLLKHKKSAIRSDAIKVIYEAGRHNIDLIIPYVYRLVLLLGHKENRLIWGALSALSAISETKPELLVPYTSAIVEAMDNGSVITRDHGIYILCHMATIKRNYKDCLALLLEQLEASPVNQVPMYAEKIAGIIRKEDLPAFEKVLRHRTDVLAIPSKEKRIEKLLRSIR